ncbi:N-glycosylation protein-domain-containing protein [Calycina marina]|uniref:N-glycosylation protein-domain-containing protein n=1 Tax=Calycina marina TaxID=1763456 RepID=A0A9P8CHZ3_9HELO|nr:N-glycosylation protein-domain-containing protein [Calycina marina]
MPTAERCGVRQEVAGCVIVVWATFFEAAVLQSLNLVENHHPADPDNAVSVLHPRVAVILGIPRHWHFLLFFCRALSTAPAAWWGLRCALTFLGELLIEDDFCVGGEASGAPWSVERRFRVTEVFLAVLWCCASAYLSWVFTDCLMSRWLLKYTPPATIVRLITLNSLNAYITSWVLFLSGGSQDPRLLLPAWISIATTLTFLYHVTHPRLAILKETSLSISVFIFASFISMCSLLLQLHLTRENDPPVPLFGIANKVWEVMERRFGCKPV